MFFDLAYHTSFTSKDQRMILMNDSFQKTDSETVIKPNSPNKRNSTISIQPLKVMLETSLSFKNLVIQDFKNSGSSDVLEGKTDGGHTRKSTMPGTEPANFLFSPTILAQDMKNKGSSDNLEGKTDRGHIRKPTAPTISLPEPAFLFSPRYLVRGVKNSGSSRNLEGKTDGGLIRKSTTPVTPLPEPAYFSSPRPVSELDAAAVKLQKVYKSYRTRRNLADCAVVVEELWWKALDFAALKQSSVLFFNGEKHETAISRWARAKTRLAKVGKGLSKDEKAQKLALQHWLEAIDPRHRYGHNLHFYYDVWFESESVQPFFYWLDVGDGKEVNLKSCPRTNLQRQCIMYLGPKEREAYEVVVENGRLVYRKNGLVVETTEGSKWIFVLSTCRNLYVGQKKKGLFQHSSFLAGGATTAAGRLVAHDGILEAIWPYSGHYHPTEENFREFISFLEEHHVDLTNVKRCSIDDDCPSFKSTSDQEPNLEPAVSDAECLKIKTSDHPEDTKAVERKVEEPVFSMAQRLSCKWSTGAGPRIGCVRDYPTELQSRALEQVNLSPRVANGVPYGNYGPIPSPRPSPKIRVSPRLAYMGLPSPRTPIPAPSPRTPIPAAC